MSNGDDEFPPEHAAISGKKSLSDRKKAKPAFDLLSSLNFQKYTPPPPIFTLRAESSNSLHAKPVPLRDKIWQTAIRIYIRAPATAPSQSKGEGATREEAAGISPKLQSWTDVCYVDVAAEHFQCPICLETAISCPRVTHCGHVYCWTCLLAFLRTKGSVAPTCPICAEEISASEMRPARLQVMKPCGIKRGSFVLVKRTKEGEIGSDLHPWLFQRVQYARDSWAILRGQFYALYSQKLNAQAIDEEDTLDEALRTLESEALTICSAPMELLVDEFLTDLDVERSRSVNAPLCELLERMKKIKCPSNISMEEYETKIAVAAAEYRNTGSQPITDGSDYEDEDGKHYNEEDEEEPSSGRHTSEEMSMMREKITGLKDRYFYQYWDGRLGFLSTFAFTALFHCMGMTTQVLPRVMKDVHILKAIDVPITYETKQKFPFLQHLPNGLNAVIYDVDILPLLSALPESPIVSNYRAKVKAMIRAHHVAEWKRKETIKLYQKHIDESAERQHQQSTYFPSNPRQQQISGHPNIGSPSDFPADLIEAPRPTGVVTTSNATIASRMRTLKREEAELADPYPQIEEAGDADLIRQQHKRVWGGNNGRQR